MGKGIQISLNGTTYDKAAVCHIAGAALTAATGVTHDKKQLQALELQFADTWRNVWQPNDDTSFYATPEYAWLTLHCWRVWSASTLGLLGGFRDRQGFRPKKILDFGAGIGLTTLQLASMFPSAQVTYANIPCVQAAVASSLFKAFGLQNVIVTTPDKLAGLSHDTVVAVEVMEHIKDPAATLKSIIDPSTVAYVDASSFAVDMAGHYESYSFDGRTVPRKRARRELTKAIRSLGFKSSWHVLPKDFRMFQGIPTVYLRPQYAASVFETLQ